MKKYFYISVFFSFLFNNLKSQDLQFTQFNSTVQYLNPAFSGLTKEHRFLAAYRNQWPGIKKSFVNYMVAYDYNLLRYNSGIGGYVLQDVAGTSNLTNTQVNLNYAYSLALNDKIDLRGGLQVGFQQKKYSATNLVFNDQLITGASVSQDAVTASPVSVFDLGAGLLLNAESFWFGFSAKHLTQPNVSLVGGNEVLPLLMSAHGAYKIIFARNEGDAPSQYLSFLFNYRHQSVHDQLDFGAQYFHKIVSFGVWYRGIPVKTYNPGYTNSESIAALIGVEQLDGKLKICYSYDYTISKLTSKNTSGAHEISVIYELYQGKARKKIKPTISTPMKF